MYKGVWNQCNGREARKTIGLVGTKARNANVTFGAYLGFVLCRAPLACNFRNVHTRFPCLLCLPDV